VSRGTLSIVTTIDVACFGELLWDLYEVEGKTEKDAGKQLRRELGGASANVAVGLAKLGISASAIGGVGDDRLGTALTADLEAAGVHADYVVRVKGAHTGITIVTRDANGDASYVPYRQGTADQVFAEGHVTTAMAKAKLAIVSTTSMLPSARAATEKFLAALEKAKGALVVDLNVRQHLWPDVETMRAAAKDLVARAAVVKGSERDFGALAGKRAMTWLEESAKQATWLITRGENGAAAVGAHGQITCPTKRVRCVDRAGGGDAFVAGVVATLVRSGATKPGSAEWKDPKVWTKALELGHLLAAKVVAAIGATSGLVGLEDAKARLASKKS
jgi:fructokinase